MIDNVRTNWLPRLLLITGLCTLALIPIATHADESVWLVAARNVLQPVLSAEYDRDMVGVLAYEGNVSIVQTVLLVFPLSPDEMPGWQQRFAEALENTGAESVDLDGDDEVEAENVPASPKPAARISCSTGEHEGQVGIACNSTFLNL